jgi:hypothetical protein
MSFIAHPRHISDELLIMLSIQLHIFSDASDVGISGVLGFL